MDICKKYVDLHGKIKNIRVAMLTVLNEKSGMRSMPMITMQTECEGNLWFFTSCASEKVDEIKMTPEVNLTYTDKSSGIYVSISGKAEIVEDRERMEQLWKPNLEEWIPTGKHDPDLRLIKVVMEHADYYDGKNM